jgi:hypothetical protein
MCEMCEALGVSAEIATSLLLPAELLTADELPDTIAALLRLTPAGCT